MRIGQLVPFPPNFVSQPTCICNRFDSIFFAGLTDLIQVHVIGLISACVFQNPRTFVIQSDRLSFRPNCIWISLLLQASSLARSWQLRQGSDSSLRQRSDSSSRHRFEDWVLCWWSTTTSTWVSVRLSESCIFKWSLKACVFNRFFQSLRHPVYRNFEDRRKLHSLWWSTW